MHARAEAIVAAARACIGTPFRPQGRLVGVALDCVGVALVAARGAGLNVAAAADYDLRGEGAARIEAELVRVRFRAVAHAAPGDLWLTEPAPGLRHLAVACGGGTVVHAHAGLRRVVEGPLDPGWQRLGAWRMPDA